MLLNHHLLESTLGAGALMERPHLFSGSIIELPTDELIQLNAFVKAVSTLWSLDSYQTAIASRGTYKGVNQPPGVCMGFDFHRTARGPKLIEINTNAGGGLLVTLLNRAWGFDATADKAEQAFWDMFLSEWSSWTNERELKSIAIVDENPEQQYLYPEFIQWQKLFEGRGIEVCICSPEQLMCDALGRLSYQGHAIDLLYNRLTDFSLTTTASRAIEEAWKIQASGSKVCTLITPHPFAHALWADKRNLEWLSDEGRLASFGLNQESIRDIVNCVPRSVSVKAEMRDEFWEKRKSMFFKPQAGFGSRATYRGDKLTKRVFEEILQGEYVAQDYVPPPEVSVINSAIGCEQFNLKYDLRVYAYQGQIQLLAARLYQGQTTNFRTPGGGFAPVFVS